MSKRLAEENIPFTVVPGANAVLKNFAINGLAMVLNQIKDIEKLHDCIMNNRVICDCGHSVFIPAYKDTKVCSWCYRTVYNTTLSHFKYKWRLENETNR